MALYTVSDGNHIYAADLNQMVSLLNVMTLPRINVKSSPYSAYGDNTHDDTDAFNNAANDLASLGGGIIDVPTGTYKTTGTISLPADLIGLCGYGYGSVIKPASGATFDVISTPIPASAGLSGYVRNYLRIENLMLDCSNMAGTVAGRGNGIHLYGVRYSRLERVYVKSCKNWAILLDGDNIGPGNNFSYDIRMNDCVFDLCAGNLYVTGGEAHNITNSSFKWAGGTCAANQPAFGSQDTTAMHARNAGGYMYFGGNIFGTGGTYTTEAIRLSNNGPCRIIGNRFDQVRYQAIVLNGGNHVVQGNQFGSPSSVGSVAGIQIGSSHNIVTGNIFDTTAGAAHYTYCIAETGGPFTGNIITSNGTPAGTSGTVFQHGSSTNIVANNG